jgi:hypothetical protein
MAKADKTDPQGASPLPLIERELFRAMRQFVSKTQWDAPHTKIVWHGTVLAVHPADLLH